MLKHILVNLSLISAVSLTTAPMMAHASGVQAFDHPKTVLVDSTDPASADQSVTSGSDSSSNNAASNDDDSSSMSSDNDKKNDSDSDDSAGDNSSY